MCFIQSTSLPVPRGRVRGLFRFEISPSLKVGNKSRLLRPPFQLFLIYHTEVEKLGAAERELSAKLSPIEALRAWMMLFVDYIATKQIIASALNSVGGGPSRLYGSSRVHVTGAIDAHVKTAMNSGDIRKDLEPFDLLRALIGVFNVATGPEWQESARRLVDILIEGSRPMK